MRRGAYRVAVLIRLVLALALLLAASVPARAAAWPAPLDGTYVVPEFRFADGETMRGLRLHYVTLGTPRRDARGHATNAVLVLHGTGGDTNQFLSDRFAGVLFAPDGLLDAARYFIVITDGIGHGASSKPSDGLRARFPHYGYRDMVAAQHLVLDRGAARRPPAPGDGHFHGRDADLALGRDVSRP